MEEQNRHSEKITNILDKIIKDWKRATIDGQSLSKIDKDILITDLKIAYELVSDLNVISMSNNYQPDRLPFFNNSDHEVNSQGNFKETKTSLFQDHPEKLTDTPGNNKKNQPVKESQFSVNKQEVSSENLPEQQKLQSNSPKLTGDLFSAPKSVSDVLKGNEDNTLANKIQNHRISDIRSAIGINDKFTFINDLFKGEVSRYNFTIDRLNSMENYDAAVEYLAGCELENSTTDNKSAITKLKELLRRRYSA